MFEVETRRFRAEGTRPRNSDCSSTIERSLFPHPSPSAIWFLAHRKFAGRGNRIDRNSCELLPRGASVRYRRSVCSVRDVLQLSNHRQAGAGRDSCALETAFREELKDSRNGRFVSHQLSTDLRNVFLTFAPSSTLTSTTIRGLTTANQNGNAGLTLCCSV
jgi:hypothetical protein